MHVGVIRLELAIHDAQSLKEKRSALRRVIDKIRNRFRVSVAEVEDQDQWTQGVIGVALVGSDPKVLNGIVNRIVDFVAQEGSAELVDSEYEVFEP